MNGEKLRNCNHFKYLGATITDGVRSVQEILILIAIDCHNITLKAGATWRDKKCPENQDELTSNTNIRSDSVNPGRRMPKWKNVSTVRRGRPVKKWLNSNRDCTGLDSNQLIRTADNRQIHRQIDRQIHRYIDREI